MQSKPSLDRLSGSARSSASPNANPGCSIPVSSVLHSPMAYDGRSISTPKIPRALNVGPNGPGVRPNGRVGSSGGSHEQAAEAEAGIVDPLAWTGTRQLHHEVGDRGGRGVTTDLAAVPAHNGAQRLVEGVGAGLPACGGVHLDLMYPLQQSCDQRWTPFGGGDQERCCIDETAG